ncbi:MarR family transcriptional regulator [Aeromicrobium senzhongii]|uniref:MarR family transcriptional regulator n=1 Tax=Aeromicrobium senzhongii TaxID=2663859 RepID=A0ABX6SRS5_9ACTN|nr:MarR family transcriptional regulator [Aeromicrobium senzhongii]MTB88753.1 MarR family transcriptional regulator [Aeromicrobium senzhongii]QNL93952.1 MarR family transcriptional regulator [Aeromicrobium senzhongii]
MPTESQRLAQAVARLNRRLRQERQSDLTATQLSVLGSVRVLGPATPSQIAARERVSQPSVTRTLKCLLEDAYVTKKPHPDDGRQVLIAVSELGEKVLAEERQRRDQWLDRRLATFTSAERVRLRDATDLLVRLAEDDA